MWIVRSWRWQGPGAYGGWEDAGETEQASGTLRVDLGTRTLCPEPREEESDVACVSGRPLGTWAGSEFLGTRGQEAGGLNKIPFTFVLGTG